jgi:F-type H+-transporting ATPase subunit epsilon
MATTMRVSLVSPDREIWSGEATSIVAKTIEGEIGILGDHEPVLALLSEGSVARIDTVGGEKVVAAVHGGFLSVDKNVVILLAQVAELAADIDVTRAKAALERSRHEQDDKAAAAALRAEARLRAAGTLH